MTQTDLLQPLVDAIEIVKKRIFDHGRILRENETRTRASLIDPILRALGWDVSNPLMVTPEFPVSAGRADYALLDPNGRALVALEAKRLNESLAPHRQQMVNYANTAGVGYAGLTDGDYWEVYRVFTATPLPLGERLVMSANIFQEPSYESALKLLLLWRPNVESGQPVEAAAPIVAVPDAAAKSIPVVSSAPAQPLPHPDDGSPWVPLPSLEAVRSNPPTQIRFADGMPVKISSYVDILVKTTAWLARTGSLRFASLPLRKDGGYILANSSPTQANGNPMRRSREVENTGMFVEVDLVSKVLVKNTIDALEELDQNASSVQVTLRQS